LIIGGSIEIVDVPPEQRERLDKILKESFDGWYLMHARKVLKELEIVRAAVSSAEPIGVIMLKMLEPGIGYVFYVAVGRAHRRMGVAGSLLRDALALFKSKGVAEVFASIETETLSPERLFTSEGFVRTSLLEVSRHHGFPSTLNMYRMMVVVPGEILMHRVLG